MNIQDGFRGLVKGIWMPVLVIAMTACESADPDRPDPMDPGIPAGFPDFITQTKDYFDLTIAGNHDIDSSYYYLKISGAIDHPAAFTLADLRKLGMEERTLTVECIGNPVNGQLLGTVKWKGFRIYDLLDSLGIKEEVTFVKYLCSDGYFTYNTLEELRTNDVLGALEMNGKSIPAKYGYPLRIIFPGFYGVRQPGWIVEIELLDSGIMDYWGEAQSAMWDTDSAMAIDSKFFFPRNRDTLSVGEAAKIGGAAYGSRRISSVEITDDDGATWIPATIKDSVDEDFVWVFWEADYIPSTIGTTTLRSRATGVDGRMQPREDDNYLDGTNDWPKVTVNVKD